MKKKKQSVKKDSKKKNKKTESDDVRDLQEEKAIRESLPGISRNARRRANYNETSVTFIRDGEIIRIEKKKEKVIGKVKKEKLDIDHKMPLKLI
jgi:hypothetical protein